MSVFGKKLRERDFCLDPDSVHLTNGSWGAVPVQVREVQTRYMRKIEWCPDNFYRNELDSLWFENLNFAAQFIGSKPENMVFVENATTAINTVLKNLPLAAGDDILVNSWTYPAITNACLSTLSKTGGKLNCVEMRLPVNSKEEFIQNYKEGLDKHTHTKLAIIDWISSPTATLMPVKELVALCHQRGVMTIIDGAHSPGQVEINIDDLGADFYTGNFHKWMFTPRGCAALWVNPKHHSIIHPLVTSRIINSADWRDNFVTEGTRDPTAYCSCKAAIEYHTSLGGLKAISEYNSSLLDQAVELLTGKWNTKKFPIPPDMEAPYLRIVELPNLKRFEEKKKSDKVFGDMKELMLELLQRFNTIITGLYIEHRQWVRLSAHAYNRLDEYERLADHVLQLKSEENSTNSNE